MGLLYEEVAQKLAELATDSKSNFENFRIDENHYKVGNKLI